MAVSQLGLYNDALLLLGQRRLASLTEAREPRYRLDDIYGIEALEFCFEMAQPTFARESISLFSPAVSSVHALDSVHTLPSDYISLIGAYTDDKLDQPLNRYIIENQTIACEFATIYVRFMSNTFVTSFTNWTPSFARVVSAYLARELAGRTTPDKYLEMDALFDKRVAEVKGLNELKEPSRRPTATAFTLTSDYLDIYNDAFVLLGLDVIATITDDSDRRTKLDRVINNGAVDYCLDVIRPAFARITTALSVSVVSANHALDNVFTIPSGYVTMVGVYSDDKLDQPLSRYINEAGTIACEFSTIYLRYVTNTAATSTWTASFKRVLSAFVAREACLSLAPDAIESIDATLQQRIEAAIALESRNEPAVRSSASVVTLTNTWRQIYNDALLILGLDEITSNSDDSDRRVKLDRALDADLVESVLEDTSWTFGLESSKITFDPSLEPEFGYTRVHQKPSDMQIINGVYQDEYMREALRYYKDEGSYFFSDLDTIFVEYVSTDFLTNPSNWPAYFRRLIAGKLAKDAAASINDDPKNLRLRVDRANAAYKDRKDDAMSIDAMNSPPRILARGEWVAGRFKGTDRNRPGGY